MKTREAFSRSRTVRLACLAAAAALLVASGVGVGRSLSAPTEIELPGASYEHKAEFDYVVYLKPSTLYGDSILPQEEEIEESYGEEEEEEESLVFFRDIVDDAEMAFSYKFDCSEPTAGVTSEVVVTITAESPGMWQKELRRFEESHQAKEVRLEFPLNLDSWESKVDEIEDDIGIESEDLQFIIEATVHTTAGLAKGGTIEDDFSHSITAILEEKTLELEGDLRVSGERSHEETSYQVEGWFDYEVYLEFNDLYGLVVLRSEELPVAPAPPVITESPPLQTLGPGQVYFPNIVDSIEASLSYQFDCDELVAQQSQEVEITAIVENPETWSKSLVVLPKTAEDGDFTVSFPVDIHYFNELIDAIEEETGVSGSSYNLNIKADVHTIAETALGTVDEIYSQTLEGKLGRNTLSFGEELAQSQAGSIGGGTVPVEGGNGWRTPWLAGLVVAVLALCYLGWSQRRLRMAGLSAVEVEAVRVGKKYKQVLVDIAELPAVKANEMVIPLGTLDALVRVADDLVKPVLHQVKAGKHIYCTIDGAVRYQFVIPHPDSGEAS